MKVLSLTEPYATLISSGIKTIETRSWKTSYRGELYIHASATRMPAWVRENKALMSLVDIDKLNYGKIICVCDLVDCFKMTDAFITQIRQNRNEFLSGVFEAGRYAWILDNITILDRPIPAKGRLGIWEYD